MRQIRKLSNLVAEELQEVATQRGFDIDEATLESKVSEIVNSVMESVDNVSIDEEVYVDDLFMTVADIQLVATDDTYDLEAGSYISIDGFTDDETVEVSLYDDEGEEIESEIEVMASAFDELFNAEAIVAIDDTDVDEEGNFISEAVFKTTNGKTKALTGKALKNFKLKQKAKKAGKLGGNKIWDAKLGKVRTMTGAEKKRAKKFAKIASKGASIKKRLKSLKKTNRKKGIGESVTKKVVEGFDVNTEGAKLSLEKGDVMTVAEGVMSVVRDGKTVISGVLVDEAFMKSCISEGVVSDVEEAPATEVSEGKEATMLTYKNDRGYVLVREGAEIPMGNRVRARAFLRNEGYNVSSDMLDKACSGELVTL